MSTPPITEAPMGLEGRASIDSMVNPTMLTFLNPTLREKDVLISYSHSCNHNDVQPDIIREITNNSLNNPLRTDPSLLKMNNNGRDMMLVASHFDRVSLAMSIWTSRTDYRHSNISLYIIHPFRITCRPIRTTSLDSVV